MIFLGSGSGGGSGGSGSGSGSGSGGSGGTAHTVDYKCAVVKVTPASGTHFAPNTDFITTWRVKNTGNIRWEHNSVDYIYSSGASLHLQPIYDLVNNVAQGKLADLSVDMHSPATNGTYTTTWTLRVGKETFCSMKMTIKVP
jgi:hypothetical protein